MGRRHRGGGILRVGSRVYKMPRLSRKELTKRQLRLTRSGDLLKARERGEVWW